MTVARELVRYKLDLAGVQEVRWEKGGTANRRGLYFFLWKGNKNHQLGTGLFVHHNRIVSAVKKVKSISDRVPYVVLRGQWCNIVLNVHVPSEVKSDDSEDSFYEASEQVFF